MIEVNFNDERTVAVDNEELAIAVIIGVIDLTGLNEDSG